MARDRRAMAAGGLVLVAAAAVAAVFVFADSSDDPEVQGVPSSTTGPAVPLRAQAIVTRTDQAVGGRFQIRITNLGDEDFELLAVALESAGFEPPSPTVKTVLYSPGERTDIPTTYDGVRCGADDTVEPAAARVRVRADGIVRQLSVPLESIHGALPKLHQRECDNARVAAAADVGLSAFEQVDGPDGPALRTELVVRRGDGDEAIRVSDVRGSVLYRLVPGRGALPVELAPGADEAAVPLEIVAARCDGHALGEAKQPYVFPIRIQLGDTPSVSYDIPVPVAQQEELFAYLSDTCGLVN